MINVNYATAPHNIDTRQFGYAAHRDWLLGNEVYISNASTRMRETTEACRITCSHCERPQAIL